MDADHQKILEEMVKRNTRRSEFVWSKMSILGYLWSIFINIIVILIVLGIYNSILSRADTIVISILIFIYLTLISIGAQLGQGLIDVNFHIHNQFFKVLKKMGDELSDEEKDDFEKANFIFERNQYKFILNSIFNFIIFMIAFLYLLGSL